MGLSTQSGRRRTTPADQFAAQPPRASCPCRGARRWGGGTKERRHPAGRTLLTHAFRRRRRCEGEQTAVRRSAGTHVMHNNQPRAHLCFGGQCRREPRRGTPLPHPQNPHLARRRAAPPPGWPPALLSPHRAAAPPARAAHLGGAQLVSPPAVGQSWSSSMASQPIPASAGDEVRLRIAAATSGRDSELQGGRERGMSEGLAATKRRRRARGGERSACRSAGGGAPRAGRVHRFVWKGPGTALKRVCSSRDGVTTGQFGLRAEGEGGRGGGHGRRWGPPTVTLLTGQRGGVECCTLLGRADGRTVGSVRPRASIS